MVSNSYSAKVSFLQHCSVTLTLFNSPLFMLIALVGKSKLNKDLKGYFLKKELDGNYPGVVR